LNAALADEIPPWVWRQARDVAIDFHDRPYYGKQPQATGLWVRGQARDGTTRFCWKAEHGVGERKKSLPIQSIGRIWDSPPARSGSSIRYLDLAAASARTGDVQHSIRSSPTDIPGPKQGTPVGLTVPRSPCKMPEQP
jgi:hypothetical protein